MAFFPNPRGYSLFRFCWFRVHILQFIRISVALLLHIVIFLPVHAVLWLNLIKLCILWKETQNTSFPSCYKKQNKVSNIFLFYFLQSLIVKVLSLYRDIERLHAYLNKIQFNPSTTKCDYHLISPYNITPESNMKVTRIKEMISNQGSSWLLHKFSLSAPLKMYWEQYGEYAYWP